MMPVFRTKASRSGTKALSVLLMGTVLAGCAAPNAMHPLAHREPTYLRMTEERAFAQALRQRYLELATNAYDRQDLARSDFYALRAIMAVEGKLVEPLDFDNTRQPDEFGNVVTRLNAALGGGVRLSAPQEAARAQAAYDCWRIESQKGGDPAIADACRSNALDAIAGLEHIGVGTRIGKAGGNVPPRPAAPAPLPPAPVAAPAPMVMAEPAYPLAESDPATPLEYAAPDQTHYAAPAIEAPMIDIGPLPEAAPAMPGHAAPLAPLPEAESFGYAPLPPVEPYAAMEPVEPAYESAPMSYDSPLGYESIDPAPPLAGTAHQGAGYESIDLGGAYAVLPEYGAPDLDMGGSDTGATGYSYAEPFPAPAPFAPYEESEPAAPMGDPVPVYEMGPLDLVEPAAAGSYQAGAVDIGAMPATEDALLETLLSARSEGNARYSVYFGFDSDEVTPEAADLIVDALEQAILEDRDTILLMGFTDSSGDARYNQLLAMRRAQAVRKFMASRTEKRFNFEILPVGEAEAVRQGGDGVVEALNRKVEIRLR